MTRSLEAAPQSAAWSSGLEAGLCTCVQASSLPLVAMGALTMAQAEWTGRLAAAMFEVWRSQFPSGGATDWRANHPVFEMGFLLGRCGQEHPFPSD